MPEPLRQFTGKVAPFDADDVDTDQIFPAQFLKVTEKKGLSRYLFYRWRYDEKGEPLGTFVLDRPAFRDAKVLVAGRNFGMGSSRENAVWALAEFGIKCIVSPSFGDIFYNNASKNGLLCVKLPDEAVKNLRDASRSADLMLMVDLEKQLISYSGNQFRFDIEPHIRERLMQGVDDIAYTLSNHEREILEYESRMPSYLIPNRSENSRRPS
jgi:3-isopropylmalate dehydratase small subunit